MIVENQKELIKDIKYEKYSYEDTLKSSIEYFNGDELAATTWMNKYAMKDSENNFVEKTPDDMHKRMAKEFGRIESDYKLKYNLNGSAKFLSMYGQKRKTLSENIIYDLFRDFKYIIPQGSVMSSLGNHYKLASLSNCIVVPELHDSYGGVFYADQQLAQLFKRRCGVGVDISNLRPSGSKVSNAAGSTSGAVSFMNRFSNTTREVAQNGRRGALMLTMDIAHPDIEDFITIKQDLTKVTGANVSIRLSDEFMKAVEKNNQYTHRWPIDSKKPEFIVTHNIQLNAMSRRVFLSQNVLYFCTDLGDIFSYNLTSKEQKKIVSVKKIITDLVKFDESIVFTTIDGEIIKFNLKDKTTKKIKLSNNFALNSILYQQNKLIFGTFKGSIIVVNTDNMTIDKELKYHRRSVLKILNFKDNEFYSSSIDHTLKKWQLN